MNDLYSTFPKVTTIDKGITVTIEGLGGRAIIPGEAYKLRVLSMVNHLDNAELDVVAQQSQIHSKFPDTINLGMITFSYTFSTKGEYSIQVLDHNLRTITVERIYAVTHELAKLRPYKGDLHIHTYYSDGRMSPIVMAIIGRRLGLDFIAITDHGKYEPSIEAIEMAQKIDLNMLLFPGEEVDFSSGHIVSIGACASVTEQRKDERSYKEAINQIIESRLRDKPLVPNLTKEQYAQAIWTIDKIHELGGYAFLAHPYWVSSNRYHHHLPIYEQLIKDGDLDGIEVIGGYYQHEFESNLLSSARYYEDLSKGYKYPIVGNSDTHYRTSEPDEDLFGWYWTTVFASSLSREDVIDAILSMRSVACERPHRQRLNVVGPFDLVEYTCFLDREFFPLHDRLCAMESDIYMDMIMGKDVSREQLGIVKERLSELYRKSFCS